MRKTLAIIITALLTWVSGCKHDTVYQPPIDNSCLDGVVYFENDVKPILVSSCAYAGCHDGANSETDIDLRTFDSFMSDNEVVKPGKPEESDLYEVLVEDDTLERMPRFLPALSAEKIETIRKWIEQGAKNNKCDSDCDATIFTYSGAVKPILDQNCTSCHSGLATYGAGLDLTVFEIVQALAWDGTLKGVTHWEEGYPTMPQGATEKLDACYLLQIENWINDGAPNN